MSIALFEVDATTLITQVMLIRVRMAVAMALIIGCGALQTRVLAVFVMACLKLSLTLLRTEDRVE